MLVQCAEVWMLHWWFDACQVAAVPIVRSDGSDGGQANVSLQSALTGSRSIIERTCVSETSDRRRVRGLGRRAWLVTWSIRLVLWCLGFTRLVRTKITNQDVVPHEGAVLLAANHTSMIDVLFLLAALRRQAIAMAMAELWKSPLTRWLVEVLGQIPVVRGDSDSGKQAMDSAVEALHNGALVGIFPEQKCVKPGEVAPYRPGVAVLSQTHRYAHHSGGHHQREQGLAAGPEDPVTAAHRLRRLRAADLSPRLRLRLRPS